MFCRKCGNALLNDARFCNMCGCPVPPRDVTEPISQPLPNTAAAAQTQAPIEPVPTPAADASPKRKKHAPLFKQIVLCILIVALTASATVGIYSLLSPKYETIYVLTESVYESETGRDVTKYEYNERGLLIFESFEYEFYDSHGQVELSSTSCTAYVFGADEDENKLYSFSISDSLFDNVTVGTFTVNDNRQMTSRILDFGSGYTSTTEWNYDDEGNLLEYRSISDGEVKSLFTHTYDADGNEIASATYKDGKLFGESEYIYDGDKISRIESVRYDDNGKVESRSYGIAKYDSHGNMIELTYYNYDDDSETARYEYIYDDHGNRLEIIQYRDDKEVSHVYNSYKAIKLAKD